MNPFCLKLDFLRNRLRVICFCLLRYAFFLLSCFQVFIHLLNFSKFRSYSSFASIEVIEVTQVSQVVKYALFYSN